jgi:hypothetical protein
MKTIGTMAMVVGMGTMVAAAQGCAIKSDDGSRFAEAIPETSTASLSVPGSSGAGGVHASSATIHIQGPTTTTSYASWYQFTRDITDAVDIGTGIILAEVLFVVHLPPTSVSAHQAVWGPGQGTALDPVVWRMTVDEVGTEEYDYRLEGRPKASTSNADWRAVLTGHGFGKARPEHRSGWFRLDNDAYASLDPARGTSNGTVKVTFDGRQYPWTIRAEVKHTADTDAYDVTVTHNQDTSGAVDITAHGDVDTPKDGNSEDVVMHSRYDAAGAGRADVQITGGSAPTTVLASECWDTSFARSYYTDNVGYRPTAGSAAACVFPMASF